MSIGDSLLATIEAFCARHGMSETDFGLRVARDGHLVRRLRDERSITLKRIDKVEKFIGEFESNASGQRNPSRDQAA